MGRSHRGSEEEDDEKEEEHDLRGMSSTPPIFPEAFRAQSLVAVAAPKQKTITIARPLVRKPLLWQTLQAGSFCTGNEELQPQL
jgi:hypothetical protein